MLTQLLNWVHIFQFFTILTWIFLFVADEFKMNNSVKSKWWWSAITIRIWAWIWISEACSMTKTNKYLRFAYIWPTDALINLQNLVIVIRNTRRSRVNWFNVKREGWKNKPYYHISGLWLMFFCDKVYFIISYFIVCERKQSVCGWLKMTNGQTWHYEEFSSSQGSKY